MGAVGQRSGERPAELTAMRDAWRLMCFFHVVSPVPRLMVWAFAPVTILTAALMLLQPSKAAAAVVPVLLLQLFAAASGFGVPACRGHYDLILTAGESRLRIAIAHWLTSIAPGVASWLALAMVEIAVAGTSGASILASGSVTALLLVSTVPWAANVGLPRFAAAIGWQVLMALTAVSLSGENVLQPLLIGESVAADQGGLVILAVIVSAGAMACAFTWIDRRDFALEAAQ